MHHPVPPASSTDQETEARPWQVQTYREFFTRVGIQRVSGHLTDGRTEQDAGAAKHRKPRRRREPAPPPPGEPARLDPRCQALWGWLTAQQPQSPGGDPAPWAPERPLLVRPSEGAVRVSGGLWGPPGAAPMWSCQPPRSQSWGPPGKAVCVSTALPFPTTFSFFLSLNNHNFPFVPLASVFHEDDHPFVEY